MLCTSKIINFSNHIKKHVRTKVLYYNSSLLNKCLNKTCICGIKYHSPLGIRLSKNNQNYLLAHQTIKTYQNYSTENYGHDSYDKAVGQTEDDFRNAVLKELEALNQEHVSYLKLAAWLDLASYADVKPSDVEFLECYYNILCKLEGAGYFYNKYYQHYCQLKSRSIKREDEELKRKFVALKTLKRTLNKHSTANKTFNLDLKRKTTEYMLSVSKEVEYAVSHSISEKEIAMVLKKAFFYDFTICNFHPKFFDDCYRVLWKLKELDPSGFRDFKHRFFILLLGAAKNKNVNLSCFIPFINTYATYIKSGKDIIYFDFLKQISARMRKSEGSSEITIEDRFSVLIAFKECRLETKENLEYLIALVMENFQSKLKDSDSLDTTFDHEFVLLRVMASWRYPDIEYVENMRNLVIKKPELLEESVRNLYGFLESLAVTDFPNQRKNYWPHLRRLIADLNILQNVNKWQQTDFFYHLHLAKLLLLWGICPKSLLTSLSERCNGEIPSVGYYDLKLILSLNQAVYALLPSFNKPFLNENTLSAIKYELNTTRWFFSSNKYNVELAKSLTTKIGRENSVLSNCFTKQGLSIDLVLALNEANEAYSFPSSDETIYIEDLSVPENFQLVLLLVARRKQLEVYSKNSEFIDSRIQLTLKSLQAMGFITILMRRSSWNDKDVLTRANIIWNIIQDKNNSRVVQFESEKIREPVFFE